MTTWKISPKSAPAAEDADLLDLAASLDALVAKDKRSAPRTPSAPKAPPAPPPFVQQWFPKGLVEHFHEQTCYCGAEFINVTGLFLEDQHRNGAIRQTRHVSGKIPYAYSKLPMRTQHTEEELRGCLECSAYEFETPLDSDLPDDLIRALSQDDLSSLKGEA